MHHARTFLAAFFVLSSPSAMADDKLPEMQQRRQSRAVDMGSDERIGSQKRPERWGVKRRDRLSLVCRADMSTDTIDQIAKASIVPDRMDLLQPASPVLASGRGALRRVPEYLSISTFAPASELHSLRGDFFVAGVFRFSSDQIRTDFEGAVHPPSTASSPREPAR